MINADLLFALIAFGFCAVGILIGFTIHYILKFRKYRNHIIYNDVATMHFDTFLRLYRLDEDRWYYDFAGYDRQYVLFFWEDYGEHESDYSNDRYVGFPYFFDFYRARWFIRGSERRKKRRCDKAQAKKCACNSIELVEAMRKNLAFRAEREQDELNKMALKIKEISLSREIGK